MVMEVRVVALFVRPVPPDPPKLGIDLPKDTVCAHDFVDDACRFCDAPKP